MFAFVGPLWHGSSKWLTWGGILKSHLFFFFKFNYQSGLTSWLASHIQTRFILNLWILKASQCLSCYFSFPSLHYFLWIGSVSGSYESLWISTCINEHDEKGKIHPLIITSPVTSVGLSLFYERTNRWWFIFSHLLLYVTFGLLTRFKFNWKMYLKQTGEPWKLIALVCIGRLHGWGVFIAVFLHVFSQ